MKLPEYAIPSSVLVHISFTLPIFLHEILHHACIWKEHKNWNACRKHVGSGWNQKCSRQCRRGGLYAHEKRETEKENKNFPINFHIENLSVAHRRSSLLSVVRCYKCVHDAWCMKCMCVARCIVSTEPKRIHIRDEKSIFFSIKYSYLSLLTVCLSVFEWATVPVDSCHPHVDLICLGQARTDANCHLNVYK